MPIPPAAPASMPGAGRATAGRQPLSRGVSLPVLGPGVITHNSWAAVPSLQAPPARPLGGAPRKQVLIAHCAWHPAREAGGRPVAPRGLRQVTRGLGLLAAIAGPKLLSCWGPAGGGGAGSVVPPAARPPALGAGLAPPPGPDLQGLGAVVDAPILPPGPWPCRLGSQAALGRCGCPGAGRGRGAAPSIAVH